MMKLFKMALAGCILLTMWCQNAAASEHFSVEVTASPYIYITIKEGCTELSRYDMEEIEQYEQVVIRVPDSFSNVHRLSNILNAVAFEVSESHPELSSHEGCIYSKSGETFLLQPWSQHAKVLRIREGTTCLATGSLIGKADCLMLPSTLAVGVDEIVWNGGFGEIREIRVHDQNPKYASIDGVLYTKDRRGLLLYPSHREKEAFDIPFGVEYIGHQAFAANYYLNYVTIPDTVSEIRDYAFWFTPLREVGGCHGVRSIGKGAFEGSLLLREVQGMEKLSVMGKEAFSATALSQFTIPETLSMIPEMAFYDCHQMEKVCILSMHTSIAEDAFSKSDVGPSEPAIVIHCFPNSDAEAFAIRTGLAVQYLDQE